MRILIAALLASAAFPAPAAPTDAQAAAIFADLKPDAPGCAASAIQDGKVIWAGGFGSADIEKKRPITPDTVFNIASDSKQFTAFSILLLEADGKLKLDDPIRKYLPELGAYADPITIRHLIHHTGGLRDYMFFAVLDGIPTSQKMTEQQAIDYVFAQDGAEFPAGSEHSYSNTGYLLLSVIVERVTGGSNKRFVESRILQPLGMTASSVVDSYPDGIAALSRAYARDGDGWKIDESLWENTGDGQVHTTVKDIAAWIGNLADGRVGGPALVARMRQDGTLNDGSTLDYAYGVGLGSYRGTPAVSHSGGWAGYNSHLLWLPERGFGAAVFCNAYGLDPGGRTERLADLFLGAKLEPAGPSVPAKLIAEAKLPLSQVEPGTYASASGGTITIAREGDATLLLRGEERIPLKPVASPAAGNVFATATDEGPEYFAATAPGRIAMEGMTLNRLEPWKPADPTRYAGEYGAPMIRGRIRITAKDGTLGVDIGGEKSALTPIGPETFRVGDWNGTMTFQPDGNGVVYSSARGLVFRRVGG